MVKPNSPKWSRSPDLNPPSCLYPPYDVLFVRPTDSKFTSFQRQLNLYQFKRRKGAHAGAFHHPCFRRGQRHLLSKVRRQKVKRDLAVEARAAQRLARAREASQAQRPSEQSGRGRTRAASQADIRPVKPEDEGDVSDVEFEIGSRRSALRRRVDGDPSTRVVNGRCNEAEDDSHDHDWPKDVMMSRLSDGSVSGRGWGDEWRDQVSGSPERSPRQLIDPSTPVSAQSSDYSVISPGSSTSDASSMGATPQASEILQCSPGLTEEISSSSHDSPLSMHSPVAAAVAAVQGAQLSPSDHGLSLAAAVDASTSWPNSSQSAAQKPFEPFTWSGSGPDAEVPWSQPTPAAPSQLQHEDFGFIDLFAENWEQAEEPPAEAPMDDVRLEAFMKEAEAAGVFGVEEYFLPRSGYGNTAVA